jgi:hypothetical protein
MPSTQAAPLNIIALHDGWHRSVIVDNIAQPFRWIGVSRSTCPVRNDEREAQRFATVLRLNTKVDSLKSLAPNGLI